jgi:hypothetical protein
MSTGRNSVKPLCLAQDQTMKTMLRKVRAYLDQRRALGYQLKSEGLRLLEFARYVDARQHRGPLTAQLAIRWAARELLSWGRSTRLHPAPMACSQAPSTVPMAPADFIAGRSRPIQGLFGGLFLLLSLQIGPLWPLLFPG